MTTAAAKTFEKFTASRIAELCHEADSADEYAQIVHDQWKPMFATLDMRADQDAFLDMVREYWTQWSEG